MPDSMSLDLRQGQSLRQLQRLIMSREMQQAITMLQLPIMELSTIIEAEIEQNPILEYIEDGDYPVSEEEPQETVENIEAELSFDDNDFEVIKRIEEDFGDQFLDSSTYSVRKNSEESKLQTFIESSICSQPSLFEYLMEQAKESLDDKEERAIAEILIGNFDERGFLTTPINEICHLYHLKKNQVEKILKVIQTFQPYGVGAVSLKDSLLIQLRNQGKEDKLAYVIVLHYFEDLIHNHIPLIQKALKCTSKEIGQAIEEDISKLDLHPGSLYVHQIVQEIVPDITLRQEDDKLEVQINDDTLPPLRLNKRYLRMLNDSTMTEESKNFIKQKIMSAKWLLRNILQRNDTLEKIVKYLAQVQREFFLDPKGKLVPLTMKTVADELQLHESTIARAVSNKYLNCPKGLLPLRSFFTNALETEKGGISSSAVRDILNEIVQKENKQDPFSDEEISKQMKLKGIKCARRTVAKYRAELNIGNANQRKKF